MSERLYYSDSFLTAFEAIVSDVRETERRDGESVWQLALNRTAFYPTSGGQPFDTGRLSAVSRGGAELEVPVEGVEEDEQGEVWHYVRKPLTAGTHVRCEIDWERRLDHMQQHTGQHLLSAVFQRELQAATVSFHLGEQVSTIDLSVPVPARHSLERVERLANQVIAEDRPVTVRRTERADAEAMLAEGKLRKLPEREGEIRLIEIAGLDLNACGGTHVRSTGQIGGMMLRGTEKVSRGTRVEFVCGLRAVRAARRDAALLNEAATALSVGAADVPAAVTRLLTETKAGAKERQKLREELASYHATRLAVEVMIEDDLRLIVRSWKEYDREYVKLLASRATMAAPATVAVFFAEDGDVARVVMARSKDVNLDCGRLLREVLAEAGQRGGGSADLAQGELPSGQVAAMRLKLGDAVKRSVTAAHIQG